MTTAEFTEKMPLARLASILLDALSGEGPKWFYRDGAERTLALYMLARRIVAGPAEPGGLPRQFDPAQMLKVAYANKWLEIAPDKALCVPVKSWLPVRLISTAPQPASKSIIPPPSKPPAREKAKPATPKPNPATGPTKGRARQR